MHYVHASAVTPLVSDHDLKQAAALGVQTLYVAAESTSLRHTPEEDDDDAGSDVTLAAISFAHPQGVPQGSAHALRARLGGDDDDDGHCTLIM